MIRTEFEINGPGTVRITPGSTGVSGQQLPGVPKFDSGGVMPGPRGVHSLALVAGGETVLPTHKGPVSVGGGGGVTVNINAPVYGVDQLNRAISDGVSAVLAERERQAGGNR